MTVDAFEVALGTQRERIGERLGLRAWPPFGE